MNQEILWDVQIENRALAGKPTPSVFPRYQQHFLYKRDFNQTTYFPRILSPHFRRAVSPSVLYASNDLNPRISNHFAFDKLAFTGSQIRYGFLELTDLTTLVANMRFPMLSILYVLWFIRLTHNAENLPIELDCQFSISATRECFYDFTESLFVVDYDMLESYHIASQPYAFSIKLNDLQPKSLLDFFQEILSGFVSENLKSRTPFLRISPDDMLHIFEELSAGRFSY